MGLLARSVLALTGTVACYSPEVQDCALTCSTADDCAGDQTCSAEHLCVSSARGSCASAGSAGGIGHDAGVVRDATVMSEPDAYHPDAPTLGAITVTLEGKGHVALDSVGTCDTDAPQNGHCLFTVPLAEAVTMHAVASSDWFFDRWATSACPDEDNVTCTFVPAVTMQITAKFKRDN